jgi:hypothetical protein
MKISAWVGTVIALMTLSATSHADGWHKHRHHHGGHYDHYYAPFPPPRPVYYQHHHYYQEDHAYAPVVYRPYYDGGHYRPYYGGGYYRRGHSSLPILFGGVLGGVLGHELSGGDPLLTTTGAIAGGMLGHEIDH